MELRVVGTTSGVHSGSIRLSTDRRTLVYVPDRPFHSGERVVVTAPPPGTRSARAAYSFDFSIAERPAPPLTAGIDECMEERAATRLSAHPAAPSALSGPLPPGYPGINVTSNNPEPGRRLIAPRAPNGGPEGNLVIIDNAGQPLFFRHTPNNATDFQLQQGFLTYFDGILDGYYVLDGATCAVVDSFKMGNGYTTDFHDFRLMPNGHGLLMSYDPQIVRMDLVVPGGNPNATVTGLVIQELDEDKNVVFQWRSWDHFAITDENSCTVDLTAASIDYVHGNSMEVDTDGNILISSRHMNEITKINRNTGAIIWRLGPHALNNEFTVIGDPRGFSHQHDARRTYDGKLSLYDNGNCLNPQYSRGLEYDIDEVNKIVTEVWEYRHTPDIFALGTGNVQRRASGSTMICWGFGARVTDLHPDDTKAFDVTFDPGFRTYRAYRQSWNHSLFTLEPAALNFGDVPLGNTVQLPLTVHNPGSSNLEVDGLAFTDGLAYFVSGGVPFVVPAHGSAVVQVSFRPHHPRAFPATGYVRVVTTTDLFAQPVALSGTGTGTADAGSPGLQFGLSVVGANPGHGRIHLAFGLPESERIRLQVVDVQGRVVAELANDVLPSGGHERVWNTPHSGLYFVHLSGDRGHSSVRRVVVIP